MCVFYLALLLYIITIILTWYITREVDVHLDNMNYILDKHIELLYKCESIKELYDIESSFMKNISLYNFHKSYDKIFNKFQTVLFKLKNKY